MQAGMRDKLWDLLLLFLALGLGAVGVEARDAGPLWLAATAIVLAVFVVHVARRPIGRALAWIAVRLAGREMIAGVVDPSRGAAGPGDPPPGQAPSAAPAPTARHAEAERVRALRDALTESMSLALTDRNEGSTDARQQAQALVLRVTGQVEDIGDGEARALVQTWRRQFDAIPKGRAVAAAREDGRWVSIGYPEPAWGHLCAASDAAIDRLGTVLRDLER
jgi:hypothetical protein